MLRITEKEDFEGRKRNVETVVESWRAVVARVPEKVKYEFRAKLLISLIYHDSALEGEVLTHSEIQAATDTSIISDSSLIPAYEDITNFNAATAVALELARQKKKVPMKVELIKQIYGILNPKAKDVDYALRKEGPLHRLYYHTIAAPDKVSSEMKILGDWLESNEFKALGGIEKAAELHWRLMAVFPWLKESGRLSRIISLMVLEQEDYPLAVIHSIDRQAYYEALRAADVKPMLKLYFEAIETTVASSLRVYEEAAAYRQRAS